MATLNKKLLELYKSNIQGAGKLSNEQVIERKHNIAQELALEFPEAEAKHICDTLDNLHSKTLGITDELNRINEVKFVEYIKTNKDNLLKECKDEAFKYVVDKFDAKNYINDNSKQTEGRVYKNKGLKLFADEEYLKSDEYAELKNSFGDMMKYLATDDVASAKALSKEFESFNQKYIDDMSYKTNRGDSNAAGGFLIPVPVLQEIVGLAHMGMPVYTKGNVIPSNENTVQVPAGSGFNMQQQTNQDTALTDQAFVFNQSTITLNEYGAVTDVSNVLLDQKGKFLTDFIMMQFASAFVERMNADLFELATNGIFSRLETGTKVALATVPTLATINNSHLLQVVDVLSDKHNMPMTCWVGLDRVKRGISYSRLGTNGDAIFAPGVVQGSSDMIKPWGYEYVVNDSISNVYTANIAASTGGTNTTALYLVDFSKVWTAVGMDFRVDVSRDVRFKENQTTFRCFGRAGFTTIQIPANASNTQIDAGTANRSVVAALEVATTH